MKNHLSALNLTGEAPFKEWLRVKEATAFCGLTKPMLYHLMNQGLIRNTSLRARGQTKGTRLINFDSLREFLESRATGGETPKIDSDDVPLLSSRAKSEHPLL